MSFRTSEACLLAWRRTACFYPQTPQLRSQEAHLSLKAVLSQTTCVHAPGTCQAPDADQPCWNPWTVNDWTVGGVLNEVQLIISQSCVQTWGLHAAVSRLSAPGIDSNVADTVLSALRSPSRLERLWLHPPPGGTPSSPSKTSAGRKDGRKA